MFLNHIHPKENFQKNEEIWDTSERFIFTIMAKTNPNGKIITFFTNNNFKSRELVCNIEKKTIQINIVKGLIARYIWSISVSVIWGIQIKSETFQMDYEASL